MKTTEMPSEKFLRKMSMFMDLARAISETPPRKGEFEERDKTESENAQMEYLDVCVYFLHLTTRALDDRKLAEHLVPILWDLRRVSLRFRPFFANLVVMLISKYGKIGPTVPIPFENVERRVRALEKRLNTGEVTRLWEEFREWLMSEQARRFGGRLRRGEESEQRGKPKLRELENVMFG